MALPVAGQSLFTRPLAAVNFIVTYEEFVLQILPLALVLALSPLFLRHYSHAPVYLRRSPFPRLKLAGTAALICIELFNLIFRRVQLTPQADAMVAAALIDLVAAITIGIVFYIENCHRIRASAFLRIYLFIGCAIDAAKLQLFFFEFRLASAGAVAALAGCIRFVLLALDVFPEKVILVNENVCVAVDDETAKDDEQPCPYFVFPSLFLSRELRVSIENGNLMPIADEFAADRLYAKLKDYWTEDETTAAETTKERRSAQIYARPLPHLKLNRLVMTCAEIWKPHIYRMLIPRFVLAACTFSQPFILKAVIDVLAQDHVSASKKGTLLFVTVAAFVGVSTSKSAYAHMSYLMTTRLRGSFITQIIDKTHHISYKQARLHANITLMSTNIDSIAAGLPRVLELPITILEVSFGIYAFSYFTGSPCFVIVVPILVSNIFSWFWRFKTGPALAAWNESSDARVTQTSSILHQLAAIKTMGLGPTIADFLQRLREQEMKLSQRYRALQTVTMPLVQFASLMTPVIVISRNLSRNAFGDILPANVIFPTLALVASIQGPLGRLLEAWSTVTSTLNCFDRVEKFLSLPERDDYRFVMNKPPPKHRRLSPTHEQHVHPVEIIDADIAPLDIRQPVLFRLHFALIRGSITAIIGPPGTGKSILLKSMLGEASLVQGAICVQNEEMAICGQSTWLQDVSILENIIGPLPYDPDFFKRVVQCCLLQYDLHRLPGGADYVVGPGGKNLSGGQRQRIGIARTVYARSAVMLFDNPFGSLDRKTAVSIIFHLFGASGLLREMGITVALVTYLRESLDVVDRVLLLDGRGYAALEDQPFHTPAFAAHVHNLFNSVQEGPSEEVEDAERETIRRSLQFEKQADNGLSGSSTQSGNENWLPTLYIKSIGYVSATLYATLVLCLSIGEHIPNIYIRRWIESHSKTDGFFQGYASAAGVTCLISTLAYWLLFVKLAPRASLDLHRKLVNALFGSTLTFLGVMNTESVLVQFSHDASQFSRQLPFYSMRTVYTLSAVAIKISVIVSGVSYFVALLPLIVATLYYIQRFYFQTAHQLRQLDFRAKTTLYRRFGETADGIMYIRAFCWRKHDLRTSFGLLNISQRAFYHLFCFEQWLILVLGLLTSNIALALVCCALFIPRSTSEAAIGLSFFTLTQFSWTLERLFEIWTLLGTSAGALERLRNFLQQTPQEAEREVSPAPEHWPSRGNIEIESVTARYEPDAGSLPALQNLTLFIESGQRAGLIGRTGSGKTSVLNAILGFVEYSGTIKIDGVNLATLQRDEIRSRLITISQDQVRLHASIRVNLAPFTLNQVARGTSEAEQEKKREEQAKQDELLQETLTRFGIWQHLVSKNGLDTLLDDAGYSPTEIQLLCIARAILRQRETGSRVVLVDDVTSSVDFWREGFVQEIMRESFPNCTMLVAASREEAILDVSVVLEMSHGVITHAARRNIE